MPVPFPPELDGREPLPLGALVRALTAALKGVFTAQELLSDLKRRTPTLKNADGAVLKLSNRTSISRNGRVLVPTVNAAGSVVSSEWSDAFIGLSEAERLWNAMTGNGDEPVTVTKTGRDRAKTVKAKNAAAVVGALLQIIAAPQRPDDFLRKLKRRAGPYNTKLSRALVAAILVEVIEATSAKDFIEVPSVKTVDRILNDAETIYPEMLTFLYKQFSRLEN